MWCLLPRLTLAISGNSTFAGLTNDLTNSATEPFDGAYRSTVISQGILEKGVVLLGSFLTATSALQNEIDKPLNHFIPVWYSFGLSFIFSLHSN